MSWPYVKKVYPGILPQKEIQKLIEETRQCFNCEKTLKKRGRVPHINVYHEVPVHVFCSKSCKETASYKRKF